MSEFLKEYEKGDIIFREGDISNIAYIVVQGSIDIIKRGVVNPIATITSGEIIGEMSAIDGKPRSCSAIAKTKVILEEINANQLKEQIEKNKEFSFSLIQSLIKRIRETDGKLASMPPNYVEKIPEINVNHKNTGKKNEIVVSKKNTVTPHNEAIKPAGNGILEWFFSKKTAGIINLYLPPAKGDGEDQLRSQLITFLETIAGCSAYKISEDLKSDALTNFLIKKEGDILIKCETSLEQNIVFMSFFTPAANINTYGNLLHNSFRFCLPINSNEKIFTLLKGIVLGLINPKNNDQMAFLSKTLAPLLNETSNVVLNLPKTVSPVNNAINLICFGVCAFNLFDMTKDDTWLNLAVDILNKALLFLSEKDFELVFAGNLLLAQAYSKFCSNNDMREIYMIRTLEHYKQAKNTLNPTKNALEIATIESQISFISSALGMINGESTTLLTSINSAKNALKYFSLQNDLNKWSAIANSMAQTMQFYGNLYKDIEYINDSIETFDSILDIRSKQQKPLLWAETKNNLASSYFLLGKYTNKNDEFKKAADFFEEATSVYKAHKQEKKAHVSLRNHKLAMAAFEKTINRNPENNDKWRLELDKNSSAEDTLHHNDDEWQKEILNLDSV